MSASWCFILDLVMSHISLITSLVGLFAANESYGGRSMLRANPINAARVVLAQSHESYRSPMSTKARLMDTVENDAVRLKILKIPFI